MSEDRQLPATKPSTYAALLAWLNWRFPLEDVNAGVKAGTQKETKH